MRLVISPASVIMSTVVSCCSEFCHNSRYLTKKRSTLKQPVSSAQAGVFANPGKASIQAALAPFGAPPSGDVACVGLVAGTKCEYLYYVLADSAGRHVFATTYDQHLVNIEKARVAGVLP